MSLGKRKKTKEWAKWEDEVVFKDWGGYMAAKKAKLEEQFNEFAKGEFKDISALFHGVAIFVNGYTDPTSDELKSLMMQHGGTYHYYLRPGQTTHMIASNLPYTKIVKYMKSKNPLPLCKPSWITDSIKAGKILDFRKYLLYSQCTTTQPNLLNIFKPTTKKSSENNSTLDQSESSKTSSLLEDEPPSIFKKNGSVSNSPMPSTSKKCSTPLNVSQKKFPSEESFFKDSIHQSSTSKVSPKNRISTTASRVEFSKLETSITKPPKENPELNKSNEKKLPEVSKLQIDNSTSSAVTTDKNKSKSSYSNCSKNSDFISEFYNNSRLHHIATMGATFKDYINELREKNDKFPGLDQLIFECKLNRPGPSTRHDSDSEEDIFAIDSSPEMVPENVIMHIDMDCFFVSVGIRNRPELKGLPVAVTHAKGNKPSNNTDGNQEGSKSYSEIASCSYEARKLGLKNGMFLGQALKLCPNLKTIKYDFEGYKEVSYALYDTVASYTLDIEAVSCDEMYADISKILSKTGLTPLEFADVLRKEIKQKTGCPVSTGFGSNKLQARLATKKAKPDGKHYLKDEAVLKYIGTLHVKDLPGVGYSTTSKLKAMNVRTCADLQTVGLSALQKEFGKKTGELLYNMCRGIDNSKLSLEHVRKSISAEVNYGIRFENHAEAEQFLEKLSLEVCTRLKKANAKGRCLTLKMMIRAKEAPKETVKFMGHGHCDLFTRSKNCISAVDELSIITKEILILFNQAQQVPEDIRGIGIQVSRLEIVKRKSNTGGLMSFINKAKQTNSEVNVESSNKPNQDLDTKNKNSLSTSSNSETSNSGMKSLTSITEKMNSALFSDDKLILPSQDIDDSILEELPEDIRNEILASKNVKSKSQNSKKGSTQSSSKSVQTKQESYFREKKPNIPKGKAMLPPMEEIDMAVLVELPEDIRNELLNEYKRNSLNSSGSPTKRVENTCDDKTAVKSDREVEAEPGESNSRLNPSNDEKDLSYSQVDPGFLAALPQDMRDDVQMYCMMKRRERNSAEKKKPVETKPKGISDGWSMFKQTTSSKTIKPKSTRGRKPKSVLGRNNGVATRVKEVERGKKNLEVIKQVNKDANKEADKQAEAKANEEKEMLEIISNMRCFPVKEVKSGGQEKALSILVKCMFDLSVEQIKMQIQNWVCNSETVNEIDIVSLATYLSILPRRRQIEELHVIMKCMHRCITKSGSCVWHKTYRKIVEHVQHFMQIEYNSNLMVPSIGCNLHKCRGDDVTIT